MLSFPARFDKKLMKEMLEQKLLKLMKRVDYRPLNKSELARALEVDSQVLKRLENAGVLHAAKKGRFTLCEADEQTFVGTYRKRGRDGELVRAKEAGEKAVRMGPVIIPEGFSDTAMDGDRVLVRLRRARTEDRHWLKHLPPSKQEKMRERFANEPPRLEGEVIRVLERGSRRLVGTLRGQGGWATLEPDEARLPKRIELPEGMPAGAKAGYKALVRIVEWESVSTAPKGELVKVLGPADQPGVDVLSIIHKHGLPTVFPDDVLAEVERISEVIDDKILADREDWRDVEVITIDPHDARDFDDAIAVKELESGGWELAVHIADVSHYIHPGSALDREAQIRGNSVYMVDRVLPMLPEKLSNGICSLCPNQERLTFCAVLQFDSLGERTASRFAPAVIRSQRRLAYEDACSILKDRDSDDAMTVLLNRAWKLASILRKRRYRLGSLDLDFPETKVILDERGRPKEIRVVEHDESHQLIEEFMVAANEAVAETILKARRPSLYRIHEDPDPNKLLEFREQILRHGYHVGDLSNRSVLQGFLKKLRDQPDEPVLKLGLLKSLKRAAYHADSLGHYGLAKEHYTHFTSPIRRYTDLVVHRVLRSLLQPEMNHVTPAYKVVGEIAEHLSKTEHLAAKAELESKRLKVTEYFEGLAAKEGPPRRFEVMVTEVRRMGLFVEIIGFGTRGLIRVSDLSEDHYYRYEPQHRRFRAGKGRVYQVGDRVEAELIRVDGKRGFIDLRPVI